MVSVKEVFFIDSSTSNKQMICESTYYKEILKHGSKCFRKNYQALNAENYEQICASQM